MIEIDGSTGESGGQILRSALTLSSITKKSFRLINIRAKRPNPGLAAAHLMACKAVRNICRGTLNGAEIGCRELTFEPGEIVGGKYDFNIGTAGSVTLVAQTIIPILLMANKESTITICGGTHVMKSPGYDYFENVFIPAINCLGAKVETRMICAGYYPQGGGKIEISISPGQLYGRTIWQRDENIRAIISNANLPPVIAVKMKKVFVQNEIEDVRIRQEKTETKGTSITAWKGYRGAYVLGEKGKRAEVVANEALNALKAENWDIDLHLADQILIYAAIGSGRTTYTTSEFSDHLKTNAAIISKFLERKICLNEETKTVEIE